MKYIIILALLGSLDFICSAQAQQPVSANEPSPVLLAKGQLINSLTAGKILTVEVAYFYKSPADLKKPAIKKPLVRQAPEKYFYVYKYIFLASLHMSADFSCETYLKTRGQAKGDYPGDYAFITQGDLYILSDSLPPPDWFSYIRVYE